MAGAATKNFGEERRILRQLTISKARAKVKYLPVEVHSRKSLLEEMFRIQKGKERGYVLSWTFAGKLRHNRKILRTNLRASYREIHKGVQAFGYITMHYQTHEAFHCKYCMSICWYNRDIGPAVRCFNELGYL